MYKNTSCVSSPFSYQTRNRNCSSYMTTKTKSLIGAKNTEEFNCTDGTTISSFLVDDLIPDCSSHVNDEIKLQNLLVNNSITTCINPGEIPCKQGHSKCFNISDICIDRLDQFNHLTPCRTGSQIEECSSFECNQRYKCPGYHCIPCAYICDSKWDCPQGGNESETHHCGSNRDCKHMFKCQLSQICLHIGDVCDDNEDCPSGDDELMCNIRYTCPALCKCFLYSIYCVDLLIKDVTLSNLFLFPLF